MDIYGTLLRQNLIFCSKILITTTKIIQTLPGISWTRKIARKSPSLSRVLLLIKCFEVLKSYKNTVFQRLPNNKTRNGFSNVARNMLCLITHRNKSTRLYLWKTIFTISCTKKKPRKYIKIKKICRFCSRLRSSGMKTMFCYLNMYHR